MRLALAFIAVLALPVGTAAAQEADPPLGEGDSLVDFTYLVCTEAPESEICREAEALLREEIIDALLQMAEGSRSEGREVVTEFADHEDPAIRLAAVAALGGLHPDASDTPLLLARLNDPVPAVRNAALAALSDSSDPATIPIVDRSRDDQGSSLLPDPPPDPGRLGASLPPGAEPLRFTDDAKDGVVAFVTDQSEPEVLDYYTQLVGRPALTLSALKSELLPEWAKAPGMGFYQQLGQRLEGLGNLPQDQQMLAQIRMALLMGMIQQGVLPEELERWRDVKLWGEVRAIVLAVDPLLEMPSQLLMVYRDQQLARTGFAIQWLPAFSIPAAPPPATAAAPPTEQPVSDPAEVEALIWRAVAWRGTAEDYEAYLEALPNGAHAPGARVALERLKSEAAQAGEPASQTTEETTTPETSGETTTPETATPALPNETVSVTTPAGVTLATDSPIRQMQAIEISFSGLDKTRNPWITIVAKGTPDAQYTDWAYTYADAGTVTLPGQRAGDYEIRAILENPREVVARLEVSVVSTASGPPALALVGEAKAGQPIKVKFENLPGDKGDWIAIAAVGKPDTQWEDWIYTGGKTDGEVALRGRPAGDYELRAFTDRPKREVVARLPLTVLP